MPSIEEMDPINIAILKEQKQSHLEYNFVVWANEDASKIIGVTFDKIKDKKVENRHLLLYLVKKLTASGLPIILVEHNFFKKDIKVIDANKDRTNKYSVSTDELEELILRKFEISNTSSDRENMKSVNKDEKVQDLFHVWSRETFGTKIKKIDIDCLLFKDYVMATIEVKNTKIGGLSIESWQPFNSDQVNYKIAALFSENFLSCDFITLHYQRKSKENTSTNSEDIDIGLWPYNPDFMQFRSKNNWKKTTLSQVINHYIKKDDL
ncbi:hypothetical protein [uncultured Psychrobacter sp.]|uniref:hypothetical protein n=1 Tax=uncultured Psychrobacter sp. TaxID=259303 RepID=UPI002610DB70|nr:hypothetical protein [uncultured Psychrobacter sp.]